MFFPSNDYYFLAHTVAGHFLNTEVESLTFRVANLAVGLNIKLASYTTKMLMTSVKKNTLLIKSSMWLAGDLQDRTIHCACRTSLMQTMLQNIARDGV